jgi:hypothetical protein
VQVVAQAPPLLLAGEDEPLARAAQVVREADRVGGDRDLARDRLQRAPVGGDSGRPPTTISPTRRPW